MKTIFATIILVRHAGYQQFAGVIYQGVQNDSMTDNTIIIDPQGLQ